MSNWNKNNDDIPYSSLSRYADGTEKSYLSQYPLNLAEASHTIRDMLLLLDRYDELDQNCRKGVNEVLKMCYIIKEEKKASKNKLSAVSEKFKKSIIRDRRDFDKSQNLSDHPGGNIISPSDLITRLVAEEEKFKNEYAELTEKCKYEQIQYERSQYIWSRYEAIYAYIKPFHRIMEMLCCFAGCVNENEYENRYDLLINHQRTICDCLKPGMWGENINKAALEEIDSVFSEVPEVQTDVDVEPVDMTEISERIKAYKNRIEKLETLIKKYSYETGKTDNFIKEGEKLWEYVNLLRHLLPVIEKISEGPGDEDAVEWSIGIGREIASTVEEHRCRKENMSFLFVFPYSRYCKENEEIRIDFIVSGVDSPGLYYTDNGELVCVRPGTVCK